MRYLPLRRFFKQKLRIYENILCKILHKKSPELPQFVAVVVAFLFVCLFSFALCFYVFVFLNKMKDTTQIFFEGLQLN